MKKGVIYFRVNIILLSLLVRYFLLCGFIVAWHDDEKKGSEWLGVSVAKSLQLNWRNFLCILKPLQSLPS